MSIEHIITELTPLLQQYGYFVLALAVAIEGMGIPAPGQSLLIVASLLAASGKMSLPMVLLVGWMSSFIGNTLGYVIGRQFGHILVHKQWIKPNTLEKLHQFIDKYGVLGLLISRFVEGIKQFMCLGCGIAQMPARLFFLGNFIAVTVWVLVFGVAPAYLRDEMRPILAFYHKYQTQCWVAVAAILVSIFTLIVIYRRRSMK
ncbi:DedA family protein [Photobacterium damselae]